MNNMRYFLNLIESAEKFNGYKLVSSNENKLREFKRFGLPIGIERGKDLKEVMGTPEEVIIHKSRDAGAMHIVEDTSFDVEGMNVGVNIRWLVDKLLNDKEISGRKASWTVLLGVNTGEYIEIYEGVIEGKIMPPSGEGFGFDPVFVPNGSTKSLAELDNIGQKDSFSARKQAVDNMLSGTPKMKIKLSDVQDWNGDYQH